MHNSIKIMHKVGSSETKDRRESATKKSLRGPTPQVKEGSIGKKAAKTFNRAQSDAFWGQWPTLLWVQDQILDPFGLSVFFLRRDEAPGWVRGRPFETQDESAAQDEGPGWVRGRAVRWQGVRGEPRMSRLARMKVLHGPDVFDGWRSEDDPSKPRMGLLARMNVQDECPCSMAG
ncbi:hypothetical protein DdX_12556 [Ditylenchus destructor]|uniref:Uncharacterized protein n=1 Tax=Ditylenchus destructor TaxID=166010 RepID=A0AAD4MWU4_9BILA|nr:hypothetical protein DdX_12556 [Ditylenchus destructor]